MIRLVLAALTALALGTGAARAEIAGSSPSAFLIRAEATTSANPAQAQRALGEIGRWWNAAHTYSGDSRRLGVNLAAGGCFCERWAGGTVEHARVLMAMEHEGVRTIRLSGALGPLQEMGVSGILTFTLSPDPSGTKIALTYRVSGDPSLGLEAIAPAVDQVLMEQFGRLIRYSSDQTPG